MKLFLEKILYHAIEQNATDIHICLKENLNISFRVYGTITFYNQYDFDKGDNLINYIKYKARINTNHKIINTSGEFRWIINDQTYNFRVSCIPTKQFKSLVIRILYSNKLYDIESLTPILELSDFYKKIKEHKNGLFVISGPTGSGKSTSLYSIIRYINNNKSLNIISLEDPIEIYLDECMQIEINEKIGITYQESLKQLLRHDPDVIVIGEIRDEETAKMAMRCALTGHLVLCTIHAPNVLTTIQRLINMGINKFELGSILFGVVSQRMINDFTNKRSFIIGEYINKQEILNYLSENKLTYNDYNYYINILIEKGMNKMLFEGIS